MARSLSRWSLVLIVACSVMGCHHCFRRRGATCPPGGVGAVPQPMPLPTSAASQPAAPGPAWPPASGPALPEPQVRNYAPMPNAWQPYTGDPRSLYPAQSPEPPRDSVKLSPPQATAPSDAAKPLINGGAGAGPNLPVSIPQFAYVRDRLVAAGLKPFLDGFDWLRDNGYRTVLHIVPPGEDDSADRRQFEKHGLKYVSLEVSPQTLSRSTLEQFSRIVGDATSHPLFVYDRDGILAGGLWYLHFRTADKDTDETARLRASRLGLKSDADGEHRTMWLAIQKYLNEQR